MQLVVDKIAKAFGIHEIFKDVSFRGSRASILALSVATAAARRRCCVACCSLNGLTAVR